ncbi:hypothetical protein NC653_012425 [Populus alba x Populus x berolinensis]|uniref:Uncharacterized protein n=1 Tax=Populus alba x Populus x berolinensis TaxID=444605 RepID=A0AAD6R547_9ROSI|nr:hypothetical protein NC653_012425 [Populus alba x Populus x berolinensis]
MLILLPDVIAKSTLIVRNGALILLGSLEISPCQPEAGLVPTTKRFWPGNIGTWGHYCWCGQQNCELILLLHDYLIFLWITHWGPIVHSVAKGFSSQTLCRLVKKQSRIRQSA